MRLRVAILLFALGWVGTLGRAAIAEEGTAVEKAVRYADCILVPIPPETHNGSGYTALEVGLDGTVYIGTANYGFSAHLVAYDPKTGQMRDLASMHEVLHEDGGGINSQSKIHAKLVVDTDGKVYGATKQGNEVFGTRAEYGEDPEGFPGGHLFVYDPALGKVTDLGKGLPQDGFEGGAIDRNRHLIYYNSCPKQHLVVYDIAKGQFSDKGQTDGSPRYNVVAGDGCLYQPSRGTRIVKYDPVSDEVYDLEEKMVGPGKTCYTYPFCVGPDPMKLYGCDQYVYEFDVASTAGNKTIEVRQLCKATPLGYVNDDTHTMITGKDGKVYWTAQAREVKTGASALHVYRMDPAKGWREDLGVIRAANRPDLVVTGVKAIQGSAVGPDGTLYLMVISDPYSLLIFPQLTARK